MACQQFLLSREMVRRRPIEQWKDLLLILGQQDTCHIGEPDYENLHAYYAWGEKKVGPELKSMKQYGEVRDYGRLIQAVSAEHLAHVIYGHYGLDMDFPDMKKKCLNFIPNCPHSPCIEKG